MAEMERTEILRVNLLKENNTSSLEFKEFPGTIIGKKVPSHKLKVRKNRTRESQGQLLGATQPTAPKVSVHPRAAQGGQLGNCLLGD